MNQWINFFLQKKKIQWINLKKEKGKIDYRILLQYAYIIPFWRNYTVIVPFLLINWSGTVYFNNTPWPIFQIVYMHIDWHKIGKIDSKIVSKGIEIWLQVCLVWCYAEEKKKSLGIKISSRVWVKLLKECFMCIFN
jgi:hypothetical protein